MLEFNRIEIFAFSFLIHLLHFQAETSGQVSYLLVKPDDEVTLPCINVIKPQTECKSTTWLFTNSRDSPVTELVKHGQISEDTKDDRLSVAANCSLTIQKVTVEDVGMYSCMQYNGSNQHQGSDAMVYLSVISIHEHPDNNGLVFKCSVLTFEVCKYTVEWLYDRDNDNFRDLTLPPSCSAPLILNTHPDQNFKKPKCKVTDDNGNSFLLCSSSQHFSCEETDPPQWWLFVVVVASAALIIMVGLIIRQRRNKSKSNKTQKDDSYRLSFNPAVTKPASETSQVMADTEEGVSYASVSFAKKANSKAKGKDYDAEEEDAVTYSSVKTSPEASTDPSNIYATVNKSNKKEKVTV